MSNLVFNNEKVLIDGKPIGTLKKTMGLLLYEKFEREAHTFKKSNAWSIPIELASKADIVHFKSELRDYWISNEDIIRYGEYYKFPGAESKVYVPKQYWRESMEIKGKEQADPAKQKLIDRIGESWYEKLGAEFEKEYFIRIRDGINNARKMGKIIYPSNSDIFRAFKLTPYDKVKIVILGQDPYHDGSADGLAFSNSEDKRGDTSPSLNKIIKEAERIYPSHFSPALMTGDLKHWAKQGVFLYNTALTVPAGKPRFHSKHWEPFTKEVLKKLSEHPRNLVFMLWGNDAKAYKPLIADRHLVLEAEHPVAAAYANRDWDSGECFKKANRQLREWGDNDTIIW